MVRYPHIMVITTAADSTRDDAGNWIPGGTTTREAECRVLPQTNGNDYVTGQDGTRIDFSWVVYMPVQAVDIKVGSSVEIQNAGNVIAKGSVKRFFTSQLNSKAWL